MDVVGTRRGRSSKVDGVKAEGGWVVRTTTWQASSDDHICLKISFQTARVGFHAPLWCTDAFAVPKWEDLGRPVV